MAESALAKLPMPARVGITLGLMALTGIAYYVVMYSDVENAITQAKNKRTKLRADLVAAKEAEAQYQKDLEELARRRERERELNKILPSTTEYPAFLSSVQSVANSSGVELTSWNPQGELREDYYSKVPMKVTLRGRYHQIAKFFYGIGQNDRIMNIENISLAQPKALAGEIQLEVAGLVTAFRAAEDAPKKKERSRR